MTDDVPSTAVDAQSASFRAEARAVGAGRGWDWLVEAFALFRRQPGMWILMVVVLGVLFVLMSMIPVLGSLASALLLPIFGAGLMLGCRALDREGTLEMTHLFAGFKEKTGNLVMIGVFNLVSALFQRRIWREISDQRARIPHNAGYAGGHQADDFQGGLREHFSRHKNKRHLSDRYDRYGQGILLRLRR